MDSSIKLLPVEVIFFYIPMEPELMLFILAVTKDTKDIVGVCRLAADDITRTIDYFFWHQMYLLKIFCLALKSMTISKQLPSVKSPRAASILAALSIHFCLCTWVISLP